MFTAGELSVDGILSEVAFDLNEVLHCDSPCVCSRPVRDILPEGRGTCELPRAPGVRARAKRKSFWKGTRSQRGGRSPKPRRGESFHCRAAGRERSEVPRLSARVRTQGEMKSLVSKGESEDESPGTQRPVPVCEGSLGSLVTRLGGQRVKMMKTGASECRSIWRLHRPHGRSVILDTASGQSRVGAAANVRERTRPAPTSALYCPTKGRWSC